MRSGPACLTVNPVDGSVRVYHARYVTAVYLRGAIDAVAAGDLRAALAKALVRRRPGHHILVDLTEATSVDPIGVGAVIAARDAAADTRMVFSLRCPSAVLEEAFA